MERLSHESTGPGPPVVEQDPRGDGAPPREANLPADAYTPYSIPLSGTLLQDPPRTSANVSQKGDEDGLPQASGEDDPTMDFEWFGDLLSDDGIMWYNWDQASKSCDFGWEGYTASLTDWYDLIQLTAPDKALSVVHVRGPYSNKPDSILARAQRSCPKDSFGLKFIEEDGVVLDGVTSQGLVNLRWPYMEYELTKNDVDYALCKLCSFVKGGKVYQVARVSSVPQKDLQDQAVSNEQRKLKFGIGGIIRFGHAANLDSTEPIWDKYILELSQNNCLLTCRSMRHQKSLKIRLYVNRNPSPLSFQDPPNVPVMDSQTDPIPPQEYPHKTVDISSEHEILFGDKPVVIVLEMALVTEEPVSQETKKPSSIIQPTVLEAALKVEADTPGAINTEGGSDRPLEMIPEKFSNIVKDYLGAGDTSIHAPYLLWRDRILEDDGGFDLFQTNVIGRAIENVMCVSSVPVTLQVTWKKSTDLLLGQSSGNQVDEAQPQQAEAVISTVSATIPSAETTTKQNTAIDMNKQLTSTAMPMKRPEDNNMKSEPLEYTQTFESGIALLQNIMTSHFLDWKSTFSQIRILVKGYCYLESQASLKPLPDENENSGRLAGIYKLYRARLLHYIQGVLLWIMDKGPIPRSKVSLMPTTMGGEEMPYDPDLNSIESTLYPAIIAWYIIKNIPDLFHKPVVKAQFWATVATPGWHIFLGRQVKEPKSFALLRWYNFMSMAEIAKLLQADDARQLEDKTWFEVKVFEEKAKFWKSRSERSLRSSGKGQSSSPSMDYELVDLVLLAQELSATPSTMQQPSSSVSWVKKLIQSREATSIINPGSKPRVRQENNSTPATSAPWELSCLNHVSTLRVAADYIESEAAEQNCRKFMSSDYSFVPSWDHSQPEIVGQLWDASTSCDISLALLDNILKETQTVGSTSDPPIPRSAREVGTTPGGLGLESETKLLLETNLGQYSVNVKDPTLDDFARRQLEVSQRILSTLMKSSEDAEEFDWTTRQPGLLNHSNAFFRSLDDTPERFQTKQTKNINLRSNIKYYFRRKNDGKDIDPPNWTLADIEQQLKPEDLLYISCFDLDFESPLRPDPDDIAQVFVLSQKGRADSMFQTLSFKDTTGYSISNEPAMKERNGKQIPSLWSLYLNGHPEIHPTFKSLPKEIQALLTDSKILHDHRIKYQKALLSVLTDSLVDLGTRHRILFAHRTTPKIVQAFIYMIHTDSIDTFDDYFGPVSSFFNIPSNPGGDWITSITISYWGLIRNNEGLSEDFDEVRGDKAAFPPKSVSGGMRVLRRAFSRATTKANDVEIGLLSSSIVFSGPELGNTWTCSVISSLVDEISIQEIIREEVTEIVQMFIHQPSSGRCLAFLLLLGYLCENLTRECETFTHSLDDIMGMGIVLLKGIEWEKSEVALRKLKKMLWCLEALRNFDDKLSTALGEIKEARKQIQHLLSKSPGRRHKDLSRLVESQLEDFDKRAGHLEDAHSSILQRIDQSTRLREGITSVLGVEQNENIGMLTYITLAYLPLGFIAALFSAGHNVIPDSFGSRTFSLLTIGFFIATFVFALSLQTILGTSHKIYKAVDKQAEAWDRRQMLRERAAEAERKRKQGEREKGIERSEKSGKWEGVRGVFRRKGKSIGIGRVEVKAVDEEARIGNGHAGRSSSGSVNKVNAVGKA